MRAILFLLAVALGGLWWGGHSFYVASRNSTPIEITCADFIAHRPDAEWLRLTKCEPDVDNIAFASTDTRVSTAYIPLRPEGSPDGTATKILVERSDNEMLELATELNAAGKHDREPGEVTIKRLAAALQPPDQGLVEVGLALSDSRQKELAALNLGLAPDFVILERDKSPSSYGEAAGALAIGVAALCLAGLLVVRRFRRR